MSTTENRLTNSTITQQAPLALADFLYDRPQPRGIDALCTLEHFSIITYAVPIERFAGLIHPRFALDAIVVDGQPCGLLSVVPFTDKVFTSAVYPFPRFTMGQTNYRIYVVDTETGEKCVWFLGTTVDTWSIFVPRNIWNMPWHRGRICFDCEYDETAQRYARYQMSTKSDWAPASVELTSPSSAALDFPGFPDLDTALVTLTHPLIGFYDRRDGRLGRYQVWHKQLEVRPGRLAAASFGLLSRMKLVDETEQQAPYNVLIERQNEFTVYLPPRVVD
ncbi:DUF2071 domain-containing protein [Blastopirellula marina]|uniref:DUF2071 domain-containing protein n=1 Tax=Blastopirellula marina DSM 3645 TaxID=314230 RepID=A3ZWS8_9BACT|nr:DUF2071 domain-containing protein [Blastopirellula marina]EAQ79052.1 hypothetical protein DSM3645_13850 [Blastopirellula marina DSM 3645]